jgi:hypothetical protein
LRGRPGVTLSALRVAIRLPGQGVHNAFVSLPNYWKHLFEDTPLCGAVPLGGWPRMFAFPGATGIVAAVLSLMIGRRPAQPVPLCQTAFR